MFGQGPGFSESLFAHLTCKRFFTFVSSEMSFQRLLAQERLGADIAFELFDPEVSLDMQPVLGARGEGSRAQVTLEGSVPGVDPDVLLQVPLLAEHLGTEGTLE